MHVKRCTIHFLKEVAAYEGHLSSVTYEVSFQFGLYADGEVSDRPLCLFCFCDLRGCGRKMSHDWSPSMSLWVSLSCSPGSRAVRCCIRDLAVATAYA